MTPFIDVNVWAYLVNQASPFHKKVKAFLDSYLEGQKGFSLSWQVFYEFVRVVTDPKLFEHPTSWKEAFAFMQTIFNLENARVLQEGSHHAEAIRYAMEQSGYTRGYFIHDCHIAALLYESGVKSIITADQDFRRFSFLEVIDPTA